MTKLRVNQLIDEAEELLDNKFHVGSYSLLININDFQDILSKIRAILPEEIKTAEMILKRRDDIYLEAQNRADRIINEAQTKAASLLSENELIKAVREKAVSIQDQVKGSCEEMKNKAAEEAENIRKSAYQEAMQTKEGAKSYASEILENLEHDIDKVYKHIKKCREYITSQQQSENNRPRSSKEPAVPVRPQTQQTKSEVKAKAE